MQEAGGAGVDPLAYRRVMGRFATGVTVVTAHVDGLQHAMTVSSLTSVSLDPVLVLICVEKVARFHAPLLAAGEWAVSVLGADLAAASRHFAIRGRDMRNELAGWATEPGQVVGAAVFGGALATVECRTWATYDGGDHTIVVGEVVHVAAPREDGVPLLYYRGGYRTLG